MRRWFLIRDRADSGPVGRLAEVVELENGMAVIGWLPLHTGGKAKVDTYESIGAIERRLSRDERLEPVGLRAVR